MNLRPCGIGDTRPISENLLKQLNVEGYTELLAVIDAALRTVQ